MRRTTPTLIALLAAVSAAPAAADYSWNWTNLSNPNWDISVTDFGYSDYLLDHTPGFEGREYLSGEWGAAVGYVRGGQTVSPIWLEPRFSFPDWDTNSNFGVLQPMTDNGPTSQGLPTLRSIVGNGTLQITQDLRFVDTVGGVAMGLAAASAGGGGSYKLSNRYVLEQSYTFTNVSGQTLEQVQMFQFLHGLTSQQGVYDNRAYGGAMPAYRYGVTLSGDAMSSGGQFDYLAFASSQAPSAVEIGRYGIEGVDDHVVGKPSVGTHLSIEQNALSGADAFAPAERWVGGAQRFDLGTLADGQSATFTTTLAILTGWQVGGGDGGSSGSVNGGAGVPGGIDYHFLGSNSSGQLFAEFSLADAGEIAERIAAGEFGALSFAVPGRVLQIYDLEFEGSFSGGVQLTFGFDPSALSLANAGSLHIYHWTDGSWVDLGGIVDIAGGRITVVSDSLSPFALGAPVPEPASWILLLAGGALVARRLRPR